MDSKKINGVIDRINNIERCVARLAFYPDYEPDVDVFRYRRMLEIGIECKELRKELMDEFYNSIGTETDPVEIPEEE